jgi:hypothetical protein
LSFVTYGTKFNPPCSGIWGIKNKGYYMERVETLIKKLQDQLAAKTPAAQMLITVQMLQAELAQLQSNTAQQSSVVAVDIPVTVLPKLTQPVVEEKTDEKIVQVLQVDEAEIEAELEEIKRNAEAVQKMSVHNKPTIIFDDDEHPIPTLAQHMPPPIETIKKEINETADAGASLNDKLKQSKIDLGDALTDAPIRDLRKAIGINDRFLFINELFRGDESMYERSIKTINGFSILPEAEYWMQRELKVKLGWSDANETVKQFTQLVKRRFT